MIQCTMTDACTPICDFCRHYDRGGAWDIHPDGTPYWVYQGPGWCLRHDRVSNIIDTCGDFHCVRAPVVPETPEEGPS